MIDGVYAFAHALDALKRDVCPTWKGVCPAMTYYDGGDFYKNYLLKVDFVGKNNEILFLNHCVIPLQLKAISRKFTPIWGVNHKIAFNKKLSDSVKTFRN